MIKRNLMTYAMLLLINILLFISCNQKDYMDIIWRDFTENGYHGEIEIGLAESSDDPESKYQHFKLRANETKRIKNYGMRDIYYKSRDPGACIDYYQNPKFPNKLEIFMLEVEKIEQIDEHTWKVPEKKGVEGYHLVIYDSIEDKRLEIESKDNVFICDKVYTYKDSFKIAKNAEEIIDYIQKEDFAYYSAFQPKNFKNVKYSGYILKSKIDGSYCWIDTYLN